jgi:hypothetical protein
MSLMHRVEELKRSGLLPVNFERLKDFLLMHLWLLPLLLLGV